MAPLSKKKKDIFLEALKKTGLYVITDIKMAGKSIDLITKECLEAGARVIQLRAKELSDKDFYWQAKESKKIKTNSSIFIINDRIDIAYLLEMEGIHLGQDDLPITEARKLLGKECIIGKSTHNEIQFMKALQEEVDYIAIGPIFPTKTKISYNTPLGLNFLKKTRNLTDKPIIAIGGINLERAKEIWSIGIDAVAVVSDIMASGRIKDRIKEYIKEHGKILSIASREINE